MKKNIQAAAAAAAEVAGDLKPQPRKVVHIQTVVQTVFGIVDDEGNVIQKVPLSAELPAFKPELLNELAAQMAEVKAKLERGEQIQ
jgi:hypothetical protein